MLNYKDISKFIILACMSISTTSCSYIFWTGDLSPGAKGQESTGKKCITLDYSPDQVGLSELQLYKLNEILYRNPTDIKILAYDSKCREMVLARLKVLESYIHRSGFNFDTIRSAGNKGCRVIKVTANTWTKVGLPNCRYRETNDSTLYQISNNFGCATTHNLELMVANKKDLTRPNNSPIIFESDPFMRAILLVNY